MVLGKMTSQVIDQCLVEMNKNENIVKIKDKIIKPWFEHLYNYFHNYIILFYLSFIFLWLSIIILIFIMFKLINKVSQLDKIILSNTI